MDFVGLPQEDEVMGGYTWFTGDGPPDPPEQQEDKHVNEPMNSCGAPARAGQFGPLDEARAQLAAKDREIADLRERCDVYRDERNHAIAESVQLRQQRNEASILHLRAMAQRDEARECVGRLYRWANEHADCLQLEIDNAKLERKRKCYAEELASLHAALAATPEHLRK